MADKYLNYTGLQNVVNKIKSKFVSELSTENCIEDSDVYLYRAAPKDANLIEMDEIVGGTIAWNQLTNNNLQGGTAYGISITKNSDGTWNFSGQASQNGTLNLNGTGFSLGTGHVYLVKSNITGASTTTYFCGIGGLKVGDGANGIWKNVNNYTTGFPSFDVKNGASISLSNIYVQLHDLTQMFGTEVADYIYGLEQATAGAGVAFFRSLFPKPYYPYNAGELLSVEGLQSHDTVGFNQWDEQWEVGYINPTNGGEYSETNRIRMKNYIPVMPNTEYYKKSPTAWWNVYFDKNKNYVGYGSSTPNAVFTTPNNAYYMRSGMEVTYGTTYNHDICINLSDPAKNGQYEPYVKHRYKIGSINIWDEEWEVGSLDANGQNYANQVNVRSKNYIRIIPNTTYYYSTRLAMYFYDANKTFVSKTEFTNAGEVTAPSNARYCRFVVGSGYGTVYNHDICINLSDPAINGTYEPYAPSPILRGVPKLVDSKLQYDGDIYKYDGTVTRRYGIVDLGTLTWYKSSSGNKFYAQLSPLYKMSESTYMISSKYLFDGIGTSNIGYYGEDKTLRYNYTSSGAFTSSCEIYIHDEAYSDAATFKTAMSGVYLVYELATPTTEYAAKYRSIQKLGNNGTEEFVVNSLVPVGSVARYLCEQNVHDIEARSAIGDIQYAIDNPEHTVETDVPANAVFTDTVTTVATTGSGNAITSLTSENGAVTATKGSTFLTGITSSQVTSALGFTPLTSAQIQAMIDDSISDITDIDEEYF